MPQEVLAVVPTFRPDASVIDHVRGLAAQCEVVVSDDGSPCTSDAVLHRLSELPGVTVLRHRANAGIARGLNDGLRQASDRGATWLLTVDQDTRVPDDYVMRIFNATRAMQVSEPSIRVVGAEHIHERSGSMQYPLIEHGGVSITEEVIQTGSLWCVDLLSDLGGFDESLGIDAVDAAACLRVRERGYLVAVARGLYLEHTLGRARTIQVMGRAVMLTDHEPARRTTMVRNRLRLFPREFRQSPRHALRTLRRVAINQTLGLVHESNRAAKIKGSLRGIAKQS